MKKEKLTQTTTNREPSELAQDGRGAKEEGRMSNRETILRWADYILPVVFKAETDFQREHPEWVERLRRLGEPGSEDPYKVSKEYCLELAKKIVRQGVDYDPTDESDKDL